MRLPQLRSPLARAVAPVLAGLGVLAVMGALTWGAAAYIADNEEPPERLAPPEIELGNAETFAAMVEENGPIMLPGLDTTSGEHSIVLDHVGANELRGWSVRLAHPADQPEACAITQERGTAEFKDCKGRTIGVADLRSPPADVRPLIDRDKGTLSIDLRGFSSTSVTTTTTSS